MGKRSAKKQKARKAEAAPVAGLQIVPEPWWWGLILIFAVLITYQPVYSAGFGWDDDLVVTQNPVIASPYGLWQIWTTSAADICPLTLSTFWCEHALWGFLPAPYHIVNVLQHAASAVVLWRVLLGLRIPGAWLGAALWALHPVQVESVAWVAEMKNTESGLFFLLAVLFFFKWREGEKSPGRLRWTYALMLVFAFMAMTAKSSTVILPVILCLCAWWLDRRWDIRGAIRLWSVFLMSILAAVASIWTQGGQIKAIGDPQFARTWPERLATAGDAVWFYLGKLLWPHPLVIIYPRWQIDAAAWYSYLPLVAVIGVAAIFWTWRGTWTRPWFYAFACFLVGLAPAVGLLEMTYFRHSFVADHFQYLAAMTPLALAGAGMCRLGDIILPQKKTPRIILVGAILAALAIVSWQRTAVFQNSDTLWTDTLAKNPTTWAGYNNYGNELMNEGRVVDSEPLFRKAIELNANYAEAHNNLGNSLMQQGKLDEALQHFQEAIAIRPDYPQAYNNIGVLFMKRGEVDKATARFQKAVDLFPDNPVAHANLGHVLADHGNPGKGITEMQKALELDPSYPGIRKFLGNTLMRAGRTPEALEQYTTALKSDPDDTEARVNYAVVLSQQGQPDEAIAQLQKVVQMKPDDTSARYDLASILTQKGRLAEAITEYREVLKQNPNNAPAHENLGNALSQVGDWDGAEAQYRKTIELTPKSGDAHDNLGFVLLHKGDAAGATAQFQKALKSNPNDPNAQAGLAKVKAAPSPSGK